MIKLNYTRNTVVLSPINRKKRLVVTFSVSEIINYCSLRSNLTGAGSSGKERSVTTPPSCYF